MTDIHTYPAVPPETNPAFGRALRDTVLSYLKWGYGGLLLSFIAYGIYLLWHGLHTLLRWLAARFGLDSEILTALLMLVAAAFIIGLVGCVIYRLRKGKGNDLAQSGASHAALGQSWWK
jgi:hypothetical protein